MPFVPSSFLLLVVMPGATSSVLLLIAMPFVPSSFLLLVVMPGATSSVLLLIAMPFVPKLLVTSSNTLCYYSSFLLVPN